MDIWNRIHESGFATLEEFPDLATPSYRDELAANAARLGLKFSFDRATKTATLLQETDNSPYSSLDSITMLNVWLFLVYRANVAETVKQGERWLALTEQGTRMALKAQTEDLAITAEHLHAKFKNLYPTPRDAARALGRLERMGLIAGLGEGPERRYRAKPLLHHIINDEEAVKLVGGVLRNEYNHLRPESEVQAELESQILQIIRDLPPQSAGLDVITERVGQLKRVVLDRLKQMKDAGIVLHHLGKVSGGYYEIAESREEEDAA